MGLEPANLARWTRFAPKGGIEKCVAQCDCVAESSDDLMFLRCVVVLLGLSASFASSLEQDDEMTVLLKYPT